MSEPVVLVRGLRKRLRRVTAVDGMELTVEPGQVMGLAGPNGSGKSVTMKVLLGLVRPSAGRVELFGEPVRPGCPALRRVGALVDGPGFVPHLSGLENLRLAWRLTGRPEDEAGLGQALELAGLGEAIARRYETYSHGMRYRLALAQALLGRPDLVVLDEPTTGLDPVHIKEVRQAIATVARAGTTVLLSSHLLHEVEQVCTHTAVMQSGRLVAAGSIAELLGPAEEVQLVVDRPAHAAEVLRASSGVSAVAEDGDAPPPPGGGGWAPVVVSGHSLKPGGLFQTLSDAGVAVRAFRSGRTLEEAYEDLVKGGAPAG